MNENSTNTPKPEQNQQTPVQATPNPGQKTNILVNLSPRDIESNTETARQGISKKQSNKERSAQINKKLTDDSYRKTMKLVQSQLPASQRHFSKLIHTGFIEKLSDIMSSSLARPNSIFLGSFFAFLITLGLYFMSKITGYSISGSEIILAFFAGWIIGLIYDYFWILVLGNKDKK
ncbi:MAG: hypothetical protein WA087_02060 [Candidatus Saccharimonadales bacterium]